MANICWDIIHMNDTSRVTTKDKDGKETFDFNTIVPMPPSLMVEFGSKTNEGIAYYASNGFSKGVSEFTEKQLKWFKKYCVSIFDCGRTLQSVLDGYNQQYNKCSLSDRAEIRKLSEAYASNIDAYGFPTWYEWRCEHWGCKWNAEDVSVDDCNIEFTTPWGRRSV